MEFGACMVGLWFLALVLISFIQIARGIAQEIRASRKMAEIERAYAAKLKARAIRRSLTMFQEGTVLFTSPLSRIRDE